MVSPSDERMSAHTSASACFKSRRTLEAWPTLLEHVAIVRSTMDKLRFYVLRRVVRRAFSVNPPYARKDVPRLSCRGRSRLAVSSSSRSRRTTVEANTARNDRAPLRRLKAHRGRNYGVFDV